MDNKHMVTMQCTLIQLHARIRNLRMRLSKDKRLKEGAGVSVYATQLQDTYVRCFGELSPEIVEALNLKPIMRNLLPFKPLTIVGK